MRTLVVLLLSLGAGCGRGGEGSLQGAGSSPVSAPGAPATARSTPVAREVVRVQPTGEQITPRGVIAVEGGALVAWEVVAEASFPGQPTYRTKGATDVVVTKIASGGAVEALHAIGSAADETVVALVAGDQPALILSGTASMTIAGTRLAPPRRTSELDTPTWGALVSLDARGAPVAATALARTAASSSAPSDRARRWRGLRSGTAWIVATNHDAEDVPRAVVQRIEGRGATWTRELPGVEVSALVEVRGAVWALTRGDDLGVARLDPATGRVTASDTLERLGSREAGDLGRLVGAAPAGDLDLIYGHSGREEIRGESHSTEPLVLVASGRPLERRQLLDGAGEVVAAGVALGRPAALVTIHHSEVLYGGLGVEHPGAYVVLGGHDGPATVVPLEQYRYPNGDDQPHQMVLGNARINATFAGALRGERAYLAGWDDNLRGVVVEFQLGP